MGRHRKLSKMFHHTKEENIRDVVKINLWRKYKKDLKGKYFKRGEAVIVYKEEEPKKFFCL